ncbi:uncharacterized protein J7T54_003372 [Emericellopsis cladophorae]|uniref:Protein kinase domain-containing protein n=1 Tax=Emericellopsis cladophorae TaxID=2686198 RepID=A0A9P9XVY8_9HYPO|nr:uncharacterized protein J7T54_003372 [Emericellopsis cladophorae]KAI6778593.1 hypothetical protein J7T54_003372 [Emericellopsis cladophorae]
MPKQSRPTSPSTWRRRSWASLRSTPRSNRITRVLTAILLFVCVLHAYDKFCTARWELSIKYSPTQFTRLSVEEQIRLADPQWQSNESTELAPYQDSTDKSAYSRAALLNDGLQWTKLGGGFEGETFRYRDVVIKVYRERHTPLRNCMLGREPEQRWPTEVAASLIMGGMRGRGETIEDDASFLPVIDYFLASPPAKDQLQSRKWHFVTEFQANGNLGKLGQRLRESESVYTARDLDTIFRPSLNRVLQALEDMHANHDLCHDDLKMDNIFLGNRHNATERLPPTEATHWLLADLGNAREREHAYHATTIWRSRNLMDCRANDVVRLMKTYLEFLRMSVDDLERFDAELFEAAEPWSRLSWSVLDGSQQQYRTTAGSVLNRSLEDFMPTNAPLAGAPRQPFSFHNPLARLFAGRRWALSSATQRILEVQARERSARVWGMASVFGVPYPSCADTTP